MEKNSNPVWNQVHRDTNNKILWAEISFSHRKVKQTVRKPLDSQKIKPSFRRKSIHQQQGDTDITLSWQPHTHFAKPFEPPTCMSVYLYVCVFWFFFSCARIIHRFPSVDFSIFSTWKCTAVAHNVSPVRFLPVRFMHVLALLLGSPQIQPHRGADGGGEWRSTRFRPSHSSGVKERAKSESERMTRTGKRTVTRGELSWGFLVSLRLSTGTERSCVTLLL